MVASSGGALLAADGFALLRDALLPLATLLTPNRPEAAFLLGTREATSEEEAVAQAEALRALGCGAVLLKGGHASGAEAVEILCNGEIRRFCPSAAGIAPRPRQRLHAGRRHRRADRPRRRAGAGGRPGGSGRARRRRGSRTARPCLRHPQGHLPAGLETARSPPCGPASSPDSGRHPARTFPEGMAHGPHILWRTGNAANENSGAPVDRLWKIWDKVSAGDRRSAGDGERWRSRKIRCGAERRGAGGNWRAADAAASEGPVKTPGTRWGRAEPAIQESGLRCASRPGKSGPVFLLPPPPFARGRRTSTCCP
jgi:Phosphomethylpyrimidine kinase